jgi:type IV pilus assembly protein PilV
MLMTHYRKSSGFSLIEVLVTIVILLVGLLGLAGLQGRALTAQMESYQRSQALILLKDMADRIDSNRKNASSYVTTGLVPAYLGTDNAPGNCAGLGTGQPLDFCEWNNALLGAAEVQGGNKVGAMIGARGCVFQVVAPATNVASQYLVVVAWQGMNKTAQPDATTVTSMGKCGLGQYKDANGTVAEALHRAVSLLVTVAYLQ